MLTPLVFYRAVLNRVVKPGDESIHLPGWAVRELDPIGIGNHCYFVLRGPHRNEVIRYDHTVNFADREGHDETYRIPVQRDVEGTGRKSFGPGDCVEFIWTGQAVLEWVRANPQPAD